MKDREMIENLSYRGRIRNGVVVLYPPADLAEGSEVEVRPIGGGGERDNGAPARQTTGAATLFDRYHDVIGIAEGLPPDFALNHDHYIHGTPKRDE
jgi:hypothetical protein